MKAMTLFTTVMLGIIIEKKRRLYIRISTDHLHRITLAIVRLDL